MLDDLKMIHSRDAQDALGVAEKQWEQLNGTITITGNTDYHDIWNIVFTGMGGSALAASISQSWPGHSLPFEVCRNYSLPAYVGERTLVIVSSYSGNTEETLSALQEATDKHAMIAVIAGGGRLAEIATERGYGLAMLPNISQPRYAALSSLKALIELLKVARLIDGQKADNEFRQAATFLKESVSTWLPTVPTAKNPAKLLAQELIGLTPVIYGGPLLAPIAYKWKISFNENAKNVAWCGSYPEFNHNEFIGWSSHPTQKPYAIIDLRSTFEHSQVQKRFTISERLLSGKRPAPHTVQAQGSGLLDQLIWTSVFGDFVSIYMALLNGLNPTPVDLVEKFKTTLAASE